MYNTKINEVLGIDAPPIWLGDDIPEGKSVEIPWNKGVRCPELDGNQRAKGYKPTEEVNERRRQKMLKKTYTITDPEGNVIVFNNLRKFCKDNNLCRWYVRRYLGTGEWKQYKGWTDYSVISHQAHDTAENRLPLVASFTP